MNKKFILLSTIYLFIIIIFQVVMTKTYVYKKLYEHNKMINKLIKEKEELNTKLKLCRLKKV